MNIIGPDALVFGVDDLAACSRYLTDYGLQPVGLNADVTVAIGQTIEIDLASFDPDDLPLRTARLLGSADVIVHDGSVPEVILNRARADAVRKIGAAPEAIDSRIVVILRSPQAKPG